MKISRFLVVAFLVVSSTMFSYTHEKTQSVRPQKVYVNKKAIQVVDNGFLIASEKTPLLVKTLRSDDYGFFVFEQELIVAEKRSSSRNSPDKVWSCGRCHRVFLWESDYRNHVCDPR
jgi:hypothetical protein